MEQLSVIALHTLFSYIYMYVDVYMYIHVHVCACIYIHVHVVCTQDEHMLQEQLWTLLTEERHSYTMTFLAHLL